MKSQKLNLIKFQNQNLNWIPTSQFWMKFFFNFFSYEISVLQIAVEEENFELVKMLLGRPEIDVNSKSISIVFFF